MDLCAQCSKPLTITIDPDSDEDDALMDADNLETVPDDVHILTCDHHFHWECLLEAYEYSSCPKCGQSIVSSPPSGSSSTSADSQQIMVDLNNEGGLQKAIDIMPILKEESYLRAYPEERKCRAFLEFCSEGDHRAIAELLKSCGEEELAEDEDGDVMTEQAGPSKTADEILCYQDPIGDMASGLHAAVANGHREVAWLLLLLASEYPNFEMPALVFQEAAALGVMRQDDQADKVDIRSLKDAYGQTAEDVARGVGMIWNGWIGNGRLAMPGAASGRASGPVTV
ncbi:hypothetical protein LTR53_002229 [Teratosphaeriaceae sp. CCFEE 6253]|nr:hypothetical protein LTR53_002229 [Teratosphaeriaceae sp. CCFEE 6253]